MMGYKTIVFLFFCFLAKAACCQETKATDAAGKQVVSSSVKEKIYAHTDKSVYVAGEILWFTLYNVNAANNHLFDLSKIAYVELIDSLNKPAAQVKINLHNGLGKGSFLVSPTVSSGSYKLRAYTSWMKNGSVEDFFQKDITVINVQKLTVSKLENTTAGQPVISNENYSAGNALVSKKTVGDSDTLSLHLLSEKLVYNEREKVTLSINTSNNAGKNDSAFLSVSVYRIDSLQPVDGNRIEDYLDAAPAFKTNKNSNTKSNQLLFAFAPEYSGHIITGQAFTKNGQLQKDVLAYLSVPGKGTQFYPAISDENGNIRWETKDFYGASHIIIQTPQDSTYSVRIDNPFSQSFSSSPFPRFALPYNCPNTLSEHSISMQVSHIYSEVKLEQYEEPDNDTLSFYAAADKSYRLDDFTRFNTLEEVLREYIALANVTKRKGSFHLPVYDNGTQKMFTEDPLVLLDGVPFFDLDRFMSLDPQKIQKLDVVLRRFFYGTATFDGILNWHSYDGALAEASLAPTTTVVDYDGLALQREFYSPVYETKEQRESHLPDFRNVLYWNPGMMVKEKGAFSFYTSDLPGTYVAVVQGISQSGRAGSQMITFEVKSKD